MPVAAPSLDICLHSGLSGPGCVLLWLVCVKCWFRCFQGRRWSCQHLLCLGATVIILLEIIEVWELKRNCWKVPFVKENIVPLYRNRKKKWSVSQGGTGINLRKITHICNSHNNNICTSPHRNLILSVKKMALSVVYQCDTDLEKLRNGNNILLLNSKFAVYGVCYFIISV